VELRQHRDCCCGCLGGVRDFLTEIEKQSVIWYNKEKKNDGSSMQSIVKAVSNLKNYSPLRYPGGKTVLYNFISSVIESNSLQRYTYVELFAGGAGLALSLLLNNRVKRIIINDLDYCVFSFWHSVLNETNALCNLIENTPITIIEREKQKEIYINYDQYTQLEVGFATLFLNRTNHSGILRGGVIGGKKQNGTYKIDCRFNKNDIISKVRNIAAVENRIQLTNIDAAQFLNTQDELLRGWCFFYLDPPYVVKGGNLYKNAFLEDDHRLLANTIKARLRYRKWIITYDSNPLIEELYDEYPIEKYNLRYTAQEKKQGSELMIFSPKTQIPEREIIQTRKHQYSDSCIS
jgi:DNA adenine methylase